MAYTPMIAKRSALVNALHIAASQYDQDAEVCARTPGHEQLEESFKTQASDARKLIDDIEQANTIRLED